MEEAMDQTEEVVKEVDTVPKERKPVHVDVTLAMGAMPVHKPAPQPSAGDASHPLRAPTPQAAPHPSGTATSVAAVGGVTGIPGVHDCIQCAMEAAAMTKGEVSLIGLLCISSNFDGSKQSILKIISKHLSLKFYYFNYMLIN